MKKQVIRIVSQFVFLCLIVGLGSPLLAQEPALTDKDAKEEAIEILRDLYFQRDYEIGVMKGKTLVKKYPESIELRAWYLANIARNDEEDEALAKARTLAETHPENPWSHFALARTLTSHDDDYGEEAVETVNKAVSMKPDHSDFLWLKAAVLYNDVSDEDALSYLEHVIENKKKTAELVALKGSVLHSISQDREEKEVKDEYFEKSLQAYGNARKIDSTNVSAHYIAGYYLNSRGRKMEGLELMKKAVQLSGATSVHSNYWRLIKGMDDWSAEKKKQMIMSDIETWSENRPETPEMLFRIAGQFGDLGMTDKQEQLEEKILSEYPDDVYSEWVLVGRYRDYRREHSEELFEGNDPELLTKYEQMLWDFINRPVHNRMTLVGDAYRNLFYLIREDSTVDADTLLQVVNGMVEHEGINVHTTHGEGPKALAENKVYFERAKEIARRGVIEARKKINEQREWAYETEEEYQQAMDRYTAIMYDALGWVFYHEGKLDSAEKYLGRAYSLNNEDRENIYHLGKLYEKRNQLDKAEDYYTEGIGIETRGENPNEGALEMLYIRKHGSPEGFESFMAELTADTREARREEILSSRIEDPELLTEFELERLDGSVFSSTKLKGKIAVINFWGIWCGPCVAEMPDIQELHEKYEDQSDVMVVTINNDPDINKVKKWMKEKEYDFPVLRDDGYLGQEDVHVFPTTWFLDPDQYISFVKTGYTEKLVEEFSWRIEELEEM